jgi:hypothetical protein
MPFITTPERIGIWKGVLLAIEGLLRFKFGDEGVALMPQLNEVYDADKLFDIHQAILAASTLDEVRQACQAATQATPSPKQKKKRGRKQDS